ncbi:hypothetical protein ACFY3N_16350 [Streptomyces sp. NPDC000348]
MKASRAAHKPAGPAPGAVGGTAAGTPFGWSWKMPGHAGDAPDATA